MTRTLIALAIAGLASFSAHAQSAFSSGAERLGTFECIRGQRSDYDLFGSLLPRRPLPYSCFSLAGADDVFGFSDHPPQPSETDYNIWLAKYEGMAADPRIAAVGKQRMALNEAANNRMNKKNPWLANIDLFAEPGTKRNEALANADVRRWQASIGRGATFKKEGPAEQCDSAVFRAKLDLQQMDDIRRKAVMDSFEKACKSKDKARQETAAKQANEQAELEALAETPWQLEPVPAITKADANTVGSAILTMLAAGELASIDIIVDPTKSTTVLVLDNSPKSKKLYLQVEPLVRQKMRNVRVVPTSLYSGDMVLAAEMLAKGGFNYLYRWMELPATFKSTFAAPQELLDKVKQNNEKLLAAKLDGVPFRSTMTDKTDVHRFGVYEGDSFQIARWPDRSWNARQLNILRSELVGKEKTPQARPIESDDWQTELGGTADGKETWKMTKSISYLDGVKERWTNLGQ